MAGTSDRPVLPGGSAPKWAQCTTPTGEPPAQVGVESTRNRGLECRLVAVPVAIAVAAATPAAAARPAAPAAAAAGSAAPTARPAAPALDRLVHADGAAAHARAVEGAHRGLGAARVLELDEGEAARPAGLAVGHDVHRLDRAVPTEGLAQLVFRGAEGKVSDVEPLTQVCVSRGGSRGMIAPAARAHKSAAARGARECGRAGRTRARPRVGARRRLTGRSGRGSPGLREARRCAGRC